MKVDGGKGGNFEVIFFDVLPGTFASCYEKTNHNVFLFAITLSLIYT